MTAGLTKAAIGTNTRHASLNRPRVAELRMSWDTLLPAPIPVPGGKSLVTLRDAGMLIQKLPKAKADEPAWQAAIEALMLAGRSRERVPAQLLP